MGEPCQQENAIGQLEATTRAIGRTLDRLGDVLEKIAAQGTKVEHLEEGQKLLFERVRSIEITSESEKVKVGFIMGGISAVTAGVVSYVSAHLKG